MTGLVGRFANYNEDLADVPDLPAAPPAATPAPQDAYARYQAYLGQTQPQAAPAPPGSAPGPLRGEALNQDVARTVLQKVRELGEGSVALPGNVVMGGAQLANIVARNYPQLGLKEVPEDVLRQNIPWPTSPQLEQKTTEGLAWVRRNFPRTGLGQLLGAERPTEEEVKSFAEPYQAKSTLAKGVGGVVEYAPAALAVSHLVSGLTRKVPETTLRTVEDLRGDVGANYRAAEAAGQNLSGKQYSYIVGKGDRAATEFGVNATQHPQTTAALNAFKARIPTQPTAYDIKWAQLTNQPLPTATAAPTSSELNVLRSRLSDAAFSAREAGDRKAARTVLRAVDQATSVADASYPLLQKARASNVIYERSRALDNIFTTASRQAERTGGDKATILRAKLDQLLKSDVRSRQFSKDQLAAFDEFVRGGKIENLANRLAKSAATGPVTATVLGYFTGGGIGAVGGPATSTAVRAGLRSIGGAQTLKRGEQLRALVRQPITTGGISPTVARSVASGTISLADLARQYNITQDQAAELIKESLKQTFAAQQP